MLKRAWSDIRVPLLMLAIWIAFESFISWSAFCPHVGDQYGAQYVRYESYCALRGPFLSLVVEIWRWWTAIFNDTGAYVALFAGTFIGILVIAAYFLWASIRDLVQGAEDAAVRQSRAYVYATAAITQRDVNENGKERWQVQVRIANSGQTPARALMQSSDCDVFDLPLDDSSLAEHEAPRSITDLPIKGLETTTLTRDLSATDLTDIEQGRKVFAVFGFIRYMDVFDRQRETRFRLEHRAGISPGELVVSNSGNYAT
jgi:hypothetical protein